MGLERVQAQIIPKNIASIEQDFAGYRLNIEYMIQNIYYMR